MSLVLKLEDAGGTRTVAPEELPLSLGGPEAGLNALTANLPLNKVITWPLAGDLRPDPTLAQRVATGFVRMDTSLITELIADPNHFLFEPLIFLVVGAILSTVVLILCIPSPKWRDS